MAPESTFFGTFSGLKFNDEQGKQKQYVLVVDEDPADAGSDKLWLGASSSLVGLTHRVSPVASCT